MTCQWRGEASAQVFYSIRERLVSWEGNACHQDDPGIQFFAELSRGRPLLVYIVAHGGDDLARLT